MTGPHHPHWQKHQQVPPSGDSQQHPPGWHPHPLLQRLRKRWWPWLIPVLALVVAVAVVLPSALTSSGGGTGAKPSAAEPSTTPPKNWSVSTKRPQWEDAFAAWPVKDTLVRVAQSKVAALSRHNGHTVWEVAPPGYNNVFCGTTGRVFDGTIPLAYGDKGQSRPSQGHCDHVTLLNLRTGKFGSWNRTFTTPQEVDPDQTRPSALLGIVDGVVVIAQDGGRIGLDLTSGEKLWSEQVHHRKSGNQACTVYDLLTAMNKIYITHTCYAAEVSDAAIMSILNPKTGNISQQKSYTGKGELRQPRIVSLRPLVLRFNNEQKHGSKISYGVIGNDLQKMSHITRGETNSPDGLAFMSLGFSPAVGKTAHRKMRLLLHDGTMYTVTELRPGKENLLLAYDLESGKLKWNTKVTDTQLLKPVAVDGDSLIVAGGPTRKHGSMRTQCHVA